MTDSANYHSGASLRRRFSRRLVLISAVANGLFLILAGFTLYQSRQRYVERAQISSQNLAHLLAGQIDDVVDTIDLTLQMALDEVEKQLANGGIQATNLNAFLARQKARLPVVDGLRVVTAQGENAYGTGLTPFWHPSVADRSYFIQVRANPQAGLVISEPLIGRVSKKWSFILVRRVNQADGAFGGLVYATIALTQFKQIFSTVNIGEHGCVTLRNQAMELYARYPEPTNFVSLIGQKNASPELTAMVAKQSTEGSYFSEHAFDQIPRTYAYHQADEHPLYVIVELAPQDYLAPWRSDVAQVSGMVGIFFLGTILATLLINRDWRRKNEALDALSRQDLALRKSEERYRVLFEFSQEAIVTVPEAGGRFSSANAAALRLFGANSLQQFCAASPQELSPPLQPDGQSSAMKVKAQGELTLAEGGTQAFEWQHRRFDGQEFTASVMLTRMDLGGEVQIQASLRDITALKRAQAGLEKSEARFRQMTACIEDVIYSVDGQTREFDYLSPPFERMLGYTLEDVRRMGGREAFLSQVILGEEFATQRGKFESLQRYADEHSICWQTRWRCKDGSLKFIEDRSIPVYADGELKFTYGVLRDITQQKRTEENLARAAAEISDLYDNAPCGYHSLDAHGCITKINHTELKWLGYQREELLGRKVLSLLPPEELEKYHNYYQQLLQNGWLHGVELEFLRKDGTRLPVSISATAIKDANHQLIGIRATTFDNSEQKKTTEALQLALLKADHANRAKSDFLARMSHELRTPMNAILGYTQLLQRDTELPADTLEKLAVINHSGENLLAILNSILNLAKIEAGRMHVQNVDFNLEELLEELVRLFRPLATAKQISLTLVKPPQLPARIRADQEKIRQAMTNLLSNAVKFTKQGGVQLAVTTRLGAADALQVTLEVTDTGPGIAPEEMSQLFEKFEQTSTGKQAHTGTGLGLAISRQYARLLGGDVTVESQPGKGSTFRFEIPVKLVAGFVEPPAKAVSKIRRLSPHQPVCRILIVDDNDVNCDLMSMLLKAAGFETRAVASGSAALTTVREWLPHLILMDTRMPEMDGYETIRRLRTEKPILPVKIISVSATAYPEDKTRARQAGANDFVAKPVQTQELLEKIGHLLNLQFEAAHEKKLAEHPPQRLTAADLTVLPPDWRRSFREALTIGDFTQATSLLEKIREPHPATADRLQQLASQFDTDSILILLESAESSPARK